MSHVPFSASHRVTRRARPDLMDGGLRLACLCTVYARARFVQTVVLSRICYRIRSPRASIEPSSCSLCPADTTRFHVRAWDVYSGYSLLPEHVVSF